MSLRLKLMLPLLLSVAVVSFYLYAVWMPQALADSRNDHLTRVERHLDSVAEGLIPLLISGQLDAIHNNLSALKVRNRDWEDIRLIDPSGRQLYPLLGSQSPSDSGRRADRQVVERPIAFLDADLGTLKVMINFGDLYARDQAQHVEIGVILGGITLLLVLTLGVAVEASIRRPIHSLVTASRQLARGNYEARLPYGHHDEVGALITSFGTMRTDLRQYHDSLREEISERKRNEAELTRYRSHLEELVSERTGELNLKNASLESALSLIQRTQRELIESEKMASLGRLVAGFAHEINTPIGVAVAASSHALETSKKILPLLQQDEVDEAVLRAHLGEIDEACRLAFNNLNRAADLVGRFKRTSIDQTRGVVRLYNLNETLHDILASLHDVVKRTPITVRLSCPADINLFGYPGALGQIFTNLIMNSLNHGFDGATRAGEIVLAASRDAGDIVINFSDNGKGMDAQTKSKIFEPFFTTARESGGTGLGLFVCHNLATAELKGSLHCASTPAQGTHFTLRYPATAAPSLAAGRGEACGI